MREWVFLIYCPLLFHYYKKLVKHTHTHTNIFKRSFIVPRAYYIAVRLYRYSHHETESVTRCKRERERCGGGRYTTDHRIMPEDNHINGYYVIISISVFTD